MNSKVDDTISLVSDFHAAIAKAQNSGAQHKYIEVSPEVFHHFMQGADSKYFWHGSPGVKVFKVGTRDEIEKEESMTQEDKLFGKSNVK